MTSTQTGQWLELKPWDGGEALGNVRHDLANLLLPLRMGAETLEQVSSGEHILLVSDMLNSGIDRAMSILEQLTVLSDPMKLTAVTVARLAGAFGCSSKGTRAVHADLARLSVACQVMPKVVSFTQSLSGVDVAFAAHEPFAKATRTEEPTRPYIVKGVALKLTLAAAVVNAHGGKALVETARGSARWSFPYATASTDH